MVQEEAGRLVVMSTASDSDGKHTRRFDTRMTQLLFSIEPGVEWVPDILKV